MCDIKNESFYLNETAVLTKANDWYNTYKLLPEYGEGEFIIYNILPGFSMSYSNFKMNKKTMNSSIRFQKFSKPILKVNYCLNGKMVAYNKYGKACVSAKDSTAYYSGEDNIYSVEHFNNYYECITLYGYIDEIKDTFINLFQVDKNCLEKMCKNINRDFEFLVIDSDTKIRILINDIKDAIKNDNNYIIRLRTIELMMNEINNVDQLNKRLVYYNKITIEKLKQIELYINNHLDQKMTISFLCKKFSISLNTLKRSFKDIYCISLYAYIKKARLKRGKELLESSKLSITDIAFNCGYNNHHSFSKAYKEEFKITPRDTRKGIVSF